MREASESLVQSNAPLERDLDHLGAEAHNPAELHRPPDDAMATDKSFITFICDQLALVPAITTRRMFGEYAVYCGGKVFAFVCNNQMYLKPTDGGRAVLGEVVEGFPYPGAKPYFLVADGLEDREWLARLVAATVQDLPEPAPKQPRRSKAASKT